MNRENFLDSKYEGPVAPAFIGYPDPLCASFSLEAPAPLFRKHFFVGDGLISAKLTVCALGLGVFYLNGKTISDDLFISPFGNYEKTLWCNEYDMTDRICTGENVVAVALGNGFYNENLHTGWDFDKAPWRDSPKFCFSLKLDFLDKTEYVVSDSDWLCTLENSPYRFNQLRMGEIYDCNFTTDWMDTVLDDSAWQKAAVLPSPKGTMRMCPAEPIRESCVYECKEMFQNKHGEWVFDFGQNMSGYLRLKTTQPKGTRLHIVYAEQLDEELRRKDNKLSRYYSDGETQFSTVITSDMPVDWHPDFTYYGFRYAIISGFVNAPSAEDIQAVFVHQQLQPHGEFTCSDEFLNQLFQAARVSTLSNCFYMVTDCPTREKLGWCNDAQASCEQMIQNFDMTAFYEKWLWDIFDAQKDDGDLPGIVPTAGWGYAWGSGPVSTGILFEIPYRLYQYNGNTEALCKAFPFMLKHLDFLDTKRNSDSGLIEHGLDDWAGPWDEDKCPTPLGFICTVLYIRFCKIAGLAATLQGCLEDVSKLEDRRKQAYAVLKKRFINDDGSCRIEEQTAVSMLIVNGLYDDIEPLKAQLKRTVEAHDLHFHVGMLGMQYILPALDICSMNEEAFRLLTAEGTPSYRSWFDMGATALHEMFVDTMSCNHHMYSCVIAWLHNSVLGIRHTLSANGERRLTVSPCFPKGLSFASGSYKTDEGKLSIKWERDSDGNIVIHIDSTYKDAIPFEISGNDGLYEKTQKELSFGKQTIFVKA